MAKSEPSSNIYPVTPKTDIPNQPGIGKKEPKLKKEAQKIFTALNNLVKSSARAKLITGLSVFTVIALTIVMITSALRREPTSQPVITLPTPTPKLTVATTPTPKPHIIKDKVELFIEEIDRFDTKQKDLIPPKVDLKINL